MDGALCYLTLLVVVKVVVFLSLFAMNCFHLCPPKKQKKAQEFLLS